MNTVIIAAAPVTKDKFHPVWAEFPISDKTLLNCVGSHKATNEVLAGACVMLGLNPGCLSARTDPQRCSSCIFVGGIRIPRMRSSGSGKMHFVRSARISSR